MAKYCSLSEVWLEGAEISPEPFLLHLLRPACRLREGRAESVRGDAGGRRLSFDSHFSVDGV